MLDTAVSATVLTMASFLDNWFPGAELQQVMAAIEAAKAGGAKVLAGGTRPEPQIGP
ncbi:hypothetical protein [Caballeronia sp. S22]|uniref:hypothetical protein n=1 Tax=Caballeronia sp. S22 TaxID=3137182 RepID=UPI0035305D86